MNAEKKIGPDNACGAEMRLFIPPLLLSWPGFGKEGPVEVGLLFIDVAGFTVLSEALATLGAEGAERLEQALANYFNALLSVIEAYGGVPVKISGDALSVVFWHPDREKATMARAALQCAAQLRRAAEAVAEVEVPGQESMRLAHKIGVSAGTLVCGFVGDPCIRREFVLFGEAVDLAAEAEKHAVKGEVWCSSSIVATVEPLAIFDQRVGGFARLAASGDINVVSETQRWENPAIHCDDLLPEFAELIPIAIRDSIQAGTLRYMSRHQIITAMFIGFSGLNLTDLSGLQALDRHYRTMQRIIEEHGGFLSEFEAGDKGAKLVAFFGAPRVIESPYIQAALCAQAMQNAAHGAGIVSNQSMGITTGRLYVGRIGCRSLAKFSAIGDRMNLAARLMTHAEPWAVVAEQVTVERSERWIGWANERWIQVKGKEEKIQVASLAPASQRVLHNRRGSNLLGRVGELELMRKTLEEVGTSKAKILAIEGASGMGKTRLLDAFQRTADDAAIATTVWGASTFLAESRPFSGLLPLLRALMVRDPRYGEAVMDREEWLTQLPCPLREHGLRIANLLDGPPFDDAVLKHMDQNHHLQLFQRSVVDIIAYAAARSTHVHFMDNAQFLDDATVSALRELAPMMAELQLAVVLLHRPVGSESRVNALRNDPSVQHRELGPLSRDEAMSLARLKLKVTGLDWELQELLWDRSKGNPFQVEAWIDIFLNHQGIVINEETAFVSGIANLREIPDQIESVFMTMFAKVPALVQLTLNVAAVVGQVFAVEDLAPIHPQRLAPTIILEHLHIARQNGLIRAERGGKGFFFSSPEMRDAMYESMKFEIRREFHAARAAYLSQDCSDGDGTEHVLELARHYHYIGDLHTQCHYYRLAAQLCASRYDNRGAIYWWRQMADVCLKAADMARLEEAFESLQFLYGRLGEHVERLRMMEQWVVLLEEQQCKDNLPNVLLRRARVYARTGRFGDALSDLGRANSLRSAVQDSSQRVDTLYEAALIYSEVGQPQQCLAAVEEAMQLIPQPDIKNRRSAFWNQAACALVQQGKLVDAHDAWRKALASTKEDDLWQRAVISGNLGAQLCEVGYLEDGYQNLMESLALKRKLGERREEALGLLNVGYSLMLLGDLARAKEHTEEGRRLCVRVGYVRGELIAAQNLGAIFSLGGDLHRARLHFRQAQVLLERFPNEPHRIELSTLEGELALAEQNFTVSRRLFSDALERATEHDLPGLQTSCLEGLAWTWHCEGEMHVAQSTVRRALALFLSRPSASMYPERLWIRAAMIEERSGYQKRSSRYREQAKRALRDRLSRIGSSHYRSQICRVFPWNELIGAQ